MNLRERAWRNQVAQMIAHLDERIESEGDDAARLRHIVLRDRLAGALGADEGLATTPELRERVRRDYQQAAELLGLDGHLDLPEIGVQPRPLVRVQAGLAPARPRHGDRA
jgi:hypothetical protein